MKKRPEKIVAMVTAIVMTIGVSVAPVSAKKQDQKDFNQVLNEISKIDKDSIKADTEKAAVKAAGKLLDEAALKIKVKNTSSTSFDKFNEGSVKKVVSMGDSTTFGFDHEDFSRVSDEYLESMGFGHYAKYSYPAFLKNRFNVKDADFSQLAFGGARSSEIRYFLEDDYRLDGYYDALLETQCPGVTWNIHDTKIKKNYIKKVKKADLITVGIGSLDIYSTVMVRMRMADAGMEPFELNWDQFPKLKKADRKKAINSIRAYIENAMPKLASSIDDVKVIAESVVYGIAGFYYNYPKAIDDIRALNKKAKIVLVGIYNPMKGYHYQLPDTERADGIDIEKFTDSIVSVLNSNARDYALKHSDRCCYVDVTKVHLFCDDCDIYQKATNLYDQEAMAVYDEHMIENNAKDNHQDPQGHHEIYSRIVDAVGIKHHAHKLELAELGYFCCGGCIYPDCEEFEKGCGYDWIKEGFVLKDPAKNVISMIKSIPEKVTACDTAMVNIAREEYDKLSKTQKRKVSNYRDLVKAEKALKKIAADKKIAQAAEKIIMRILEKDCSNVVKGAAVLAFDKLTDDQKRLVDADLVEKLREAKGETRKR